MAMTIPEAVPRTATSGERLSFTTLKKTLPDNCLLYYEPMIQGRKPDLLLIFPPYGILVLEVKDYKKNSIRSMDSEKWTLNLQDGSIGEVRNPLDQARSYSFALSDKLRKDPQLLASSGVHKLKFSYGFGVIMPKMSRVDVFNLGIDEYIPSNLLICKEDLESDDVESLMFDYLSGMFSVRTSNMSGLVLEDVDRIRYALFPEVRIGEDRAYNEENLLKFRDVLSMSLYQESLAKQMGEGHRMLRGVSGSGKTLILIARAKLLAKEHPEWNILILCYASVLASSIRSNIAPELYSNIKVQHFHEFVKQNFGNSTDMQLVRLSNDQGFAFPVFDAILIDEGQDFDAIWIKFIMRCLSPETNCLTIAEDRAQVIFKRKVSLASMTGLDFRGRSRVLSINYRNSRRVLALAWRFFSSFSNSLQSNSEIIYPKATTRDGKSPLLMGFTSYDQEASWVSGEIRRLVATGEKPGNIAILYRAKKFNGIEYMDILTNKLSLMGVQVSWISRTQETKASFVPDLNRVNLLTLDSSKGLDFKIVFLVTCQNTPLPVEKDKDREVSLVYIGMTRAIDSLYITWSGKSLFTEYFEEYVNKQSLRNSNSF